MSCPHCDPHVLAGRSLQDGLSKRTDTEAQERRIVAALRTGPKTTDDLRKLGIYQASARIFGLRRRGYVVDTELFSGWSADGYPHARMARYTLREEPQVAGSAPRQEGEGAPC